MKCLKNLRVFYGCSIVRKGESEGGEAAGVHIMEDLVDHAKHLGFYSKINVVEKH